MIITAHDYSTDYQFIEAFRRDIFLSGEPNKKNETSPFTKKYRCSRNNGDIQGNLFLFQVFLFVY